jgi:hypothetical protein
VAVLCWAAKSQQDITHKTTNVQLTTLRESIGRPANSIVNRRNRERSRFIKYLLGEEGDIFMTD